MRLTAISLSAAAATLALLGAAEAQSVPFGKGIDGWEFSATTERSGVVNCRAARKVGNKMDIIAQRTDRSPPYFSVNADGRKGKWPGTIINVPGKPPGVLEWKTTGEADGGRMWFPISPAAVDQIVAAGAYQWSLPDTEDYATVKIGKRGTEIWGRVNDCANANRR